jgi:hypothetical protein
VTRKQLVEDDASQYNSIDERLRRLEQNVRASARASGAVVLTWPGGGDLSNTMVVAHELGDIPQVVACGNDASLNVAVTAVDDTNISLRARDVAGTTRGTGSFGLARWIAVL